MPDFQSQIDKDNQKLQQLLKDIETETSNFNAHINDKQSEVADLNDEINSLQAIQDTIVSPEYITAVQAKQTVVSKPLTN